MRKQTRVKRDVPTDPQLRVEVVSGEITPPLSIEAIMEANEPHFAWVASTQGATAAEKARAEMRASLEWAQQHASARAGELRKSKNIVRVSRTA